VTYNATHIITISLYFLTSFLQIPLISITDDYIGLGAFAASELYKVFSGYQPR